MTYASAVQGRPKPSSQRAAVAVRLAESVHRSRSRRRSVGNRDGSRIRVGRYGRIRRRRSFRLRATGAEDGGGRVGSCPEVFEAGRRVEYSVRRPGLVSPGRGVDGRSLLAPVTNDRSLIPLAADPRAISSAGRAPPRQGGGHWFEPSIAHRIWPRVYGVFCVRGLTGQVGLEAVFPQTSHMGLRDHCRMDQVRIKEGTRLWCQARGPLCPAQPFGDGLLVFRGSWDRIWDRVRSWWPSRVR